MGCPNAECVCTHAELLQGTYSSVNAQKSEKTQSNIGREHWYWKPESLRDRENYFGKENARKI
jgi:hypothetical protein